jgi:hypothetical protein
LNIPALGFKNPKVNFARLSLPFGTISRRGIEYLFAPVVDSYKLN